MPEFCPFGQPSDRNRNARLRSQANERSALDVPLLRVLVLELALGDFLESHGQVVLRARFHQRWRSLVEADALAELVVVVVDLASPLGRDDDERIARVDVFEELIDARMDHGRLMVPAVWSSRRPSSVNSCAARSTSSLTIA